MEDCIFCKIVNNEANSEIVFENDLVLAFKNIAPIAAVHILIIPKKHITTFMDISDEKTQSAMFNVAQEIVKKFEIESGYKLVINGGKYQKVKHLHLHVLGGKLEDDEDVLNNT